jgi:hypothetical protein
MTGFDRFYHISWWLAALEGTSTFNRPTGTGEAFELYLLYLRSLFYYATTGRRTAFAP